MKRLAAAIGLAALSAAADVRTTEYPDFYDEVRDVKKGMEFVQAIRLLTAEPGMFFRDDLTVSFEAPGMSRVMALLWRCPDAKHPDGRGYDAVLYSSDSEKPEHTFVLHGEELQNGPLTVRLMAKSADGRRDVFELQLFNRGGKRWNAGIPKSAPPGAKGMKLVFEDDFDGPLSISPDGVGAKYAAHKTGGGDFSGWQFSDPKGPDRPFGQYGTWLRIHASKTADGAMSGILSSLHSDGGGVAVSVPSYFECRFVAHSAPGSWPAFWTLTRGTIGIDPDDPLKDEAKSAGCDELDVIEAYGGWGPKNPNAGGKYSMNTHFWGQKKDGFSFWRDTTDKGGPSWSWSAHTYGLAITETDTIYYLDDVEMGRHKTGEVSIAEPAWFLINYAIGGISGWQIDMERYGNKSDMWVDWVRVYSAKPNAAGAFVPPAGTFAGVAGSVAVNFTSRDVPGSKMAKGACAGLGGVAQRYWHSVEIGADRKGTWYTADGKTVSGLSVGFGAGAKAMKGEPWGFGGNAGTMKRCGLANDGGFSVGGIPYGRYDVVVYLTAGVNSSAGYVIISPSGGEERRREFKHGWDGGRHAPDHNVVRFDGMTGGGFGLRIVGTSFSTGIAGFQIVPREN